MKGLTEGGRLHAPPFLLRRWNGEISVLLLLTPIFRVGVGVGDAVIAWVKGKTRARIRWLKLEVAPCGLVG